ncbi:MAG: hypothetical protein NTW29_15220 [Bacteroidetes bacterium]|nr:hypothetical protein [Bacteroidota bacterium]
MPPVLIPEDPRLISFNTLRKSVGWLGISLPAAMLTGNLLWGNCYFIQDSNSHYYYTITGNLFVGILCAVAMFLISYKGYPDDKSDNILTTLAGICAIGIAFFPTNNNSADACSIIDLPLSKARNLTHYGFAASFFILLAIISYFKFTRSKGIMTHSKHMRNKVYRYCGVLIIFFIALIAIYGIFNKQLSAIDKFKPVFWLEWFALIAFGFSWLVKGELIMDDTPEEKAMLIREGLASGGPHHH